MSPINDPLLDILARDLPPELAQNASETFNSPVASAYLSRLTSLSLDNIKSAESESLAGTSYGLNRNLQNLASRSHKALVSSAERLSGIEELLETIRSEVAHLTGEKNVPISEGEQGEKVKETAGPRGSLITAMDNSISTFISKYHRDSPLLQARQTSTTLYSNLPRLLDLLELPTLLSSSLSNPPLALDILSHVRRLKLLHPNSPVIEMISQECLALQTQLQQSLLVTLRSSLKLPLAIKTIGYLRRAATDLASVPYALETVFLACRLYWINELFDALAPLREAAEEEYVARVEGRKVLGLGSKTERYFKRWVEVFREQSFAVVSMYRSIFPSEQPTVTPDPSNANASSTIEPGRAPLQSFVLHLLTLLDETVTRYLPNVEEKNAREGLLTQVLYAAGSLGRLGGDFTGDVSRSGDEGEWIEVVRRQRQLAGRLEVLASGKGVGIDTK